MWWWWCFLFFFQSLFEESCFLSSPSAPQLCPHDERSALLQLKQKHYHVSPPDYHLNSWKPNSDCCFWEGITCDGTIGHVVGLDLFNKSFQGSIHSNSSLFHLHHLRMLNLSNNFFSGQIPSQISHLTDLVSLDLSWNLFGGRIPFELSRLTKLVSLDLSWKVGDPQLEIPNLGAFVQNLSSMRELYLDEVNLSAEKNRDWCRHLSSALPNLQVLSMRNCLLTGPLDASISSLRFLSELHLDGNSNLISTVPASLMNLSSLTVLSLYGCGFYGDFPKNVFLQPNLKYIDLSENSLLSGHLPDEFPPFNSTLQYLSVGATKFQGKFPSSIGNLKFLEEFNLLDCKFFGPIPPSLANLTHLEILDLGNNLLKGPIHSSLFFLPSLQYLDLSNNQFSGVINEPIGDNISSFSNRMEFNLGGNYLKGRELMRSISKIKGSFMILDLSFNDFGYISEDTNHSYDSLSTNGSIDNFFNAQIQQLVMESCNISKFPTNFLWNQKELTFLILSGNRISKFPAEFLWNQKVLEYLYLSYNRISKIPADFLWNQTTLTCLDLSYNRFSKFPVDLFNNLKALIYFDISGNRIGSAIPKWVWKENLEYLNLSNNLFTGLELPLVPNHSFHLDVLDLHSNKIQECHSTLSCFPQAFDPSNSAFVSSILGNLTFLLSSASFFSISDNKLTGTIPFSICTANYLSLLDLSNNQLSGIIPTCIHRMSLEELNLENNKLHGSIPPTFKNGCIIHTLKLNENMLRGEVPRSLSNCKKLTVLNIADNQLSGIFPYWLENLTQLEVLVMRSNKFGGPIAQLSQVHSPFPRLHVIDLSFNHFTGNLPLQYIYHWKAMMFVRYTPKLYYFWYTRTSIGWDFSNTVAITEKGLFLKLPKILTTFAMIDLSNNYFTGKIPDALGILKALKVLNLSGNCFTGQIPFSLKNLSELESLDLSRNKLSGEIPSELTSLTFLEVLNLSYNNFIGSIPHGNQFDTFSNSSYEGNAGLCGLPLSRKCAITDGALPPTSAFQQEDDSKCLFDWKFADDSTCLLDWIFVVAGCCSGLVVGLVIGQQLFWTKNRCSNFISRAAVSKQKKRSRKIKHHNRRK